MHRLKLWLLLLVLLVGGTAHARQDAPQELRLLTYNLHAEEEILDPMVKVIQDADADIVALQEVSPEAAERFAADLGERYPYRAENLEHGRYNGQLILSAYPILDQTTWDFPRRLLRAELDVDGTTVVVYNVHPSTPAQDMDARSADIAFAVEQATNETAPTLLMGDFNLEEWSDDYDVITAEFTDAWAEVGEGDGLTYPDYSQPQAQVNARLPTSFKILIRLDYIFHSAAFEAVEAQVWPESGGSDHRPVYAVLTFSL
jgi:vancomycin resistance protein VanJ